MERTILATKPDFTMVKFEGHFGRSYIYATFGLFANIHAVSTYLLRKNTARENMKSAPGQDYRPVAQQESAEYEEYDQTMRKPSVKSSCHNTWRTWTCWIPWTMVLCLTLTNLYTWRRNSNGEDHQALFCTLQWFFYDTALTCMCSPRVFRDKIQEHCFPSCRR